MSSVIATSVLFASLVIPSLPSPEGETLNTGSRGATTPIFEWADYAGENSTARARISFEGAKDWCENFRPGDEADIKRCADEIYTSEKDIVYEATANCKTGVITSTWGETYTFAGVDNKDEVFKGSFLFKDETGNVLPLNYSSGALEVASQWSALCPFGHPYDIVPLKMVMSNSDSSDQSGIIGHNGRTLVQDDLYSIISYGKEEDLGIEEGRVLFRGHWIWGAGIEGIAFSFKKGCEPVGYRVVGYDNSDSDQITLEGSAPVWAEGCQVTGFSKDAPGSELIFDLPHH